MPKTEPHLHGQVFTERDLKALAWAVRRAAHNGGGFKSELAAAQRALERLRVGVRLNGQGAGLARDDAANESTIVKSQIVEKCGPGRHGAA